MDFAVLPPEVNSGRIYTGPGSASILAAATAWDGLAAELYTAAANYESVVSALTSGPWLGPTSAVMASAARPYATWLSATAAQAELTGAKAKAAASAHAMAFAMTVPPPLIVANRSQLTVLIATNIFGQNTPAIAATEAQYDQMWAQDATAMYNYAAAAQTASQLPPFASPRSATNPGALVAQAAAAVQNSGTSAGQAAVAQVMSAVPQALQALTASGAGLPSGAGALEGMAAFADIIAIPVDIGMDSAIIGSIFGGDAVSWGISTAGFPEALPLSLAAPAAMAGSATAGAGLARAVPTVAVGEATMVSGLSVPQEWTTAAPEMRLAAAELPAANLVAAGGSGGMFGGMPLLGGAPLVTFAGRGAAAPKAAQSDEELKRKAKGRRTSMW